MTDKKVYFVRHGESEGNIGNYYQTADENLTSRGREQADFVAHRVASLGIERLVASPMLRAQQTAEAISKNIELPIDTQDFFKEQIRPSEQLGKKRDSEEGRGIEKEFISHFGEPGWHYSDEESFQDLKERTETALSFLENCEESNILVVTHGVFLKCLLASVVMRSQASPQEFLNFRNNFLIYNTGLTLIKYGTSLYSDDLNWSVGIWNDSAHLGDA